MTYNQITMLFIAVKRPINCLIFLTIALSLLVVTSAMGEPKSETTIGVGFTYTFDKRRDPFGYFIGVHNTTNRFKKDPTNSESNEEAYIYDGNFSIGIEYKSGMSEKFKIRNLFLSLSQYNADSIGAKLSITNAGFDKTEFYVGHENLLLNYSLGNSKFGIAMGTTNNSKVRVQKKTTRQPSQGYKNCVKFFYILLAVLDIDSDPKSYCRIVYNYYE